MRQSSRAYAWINREPLRGSQKMKSCPSTNVCSKRILRRSRPGIPKSLLASRMGKADLPSWSEPKCCPRIGKPFRTICIGNGGGGGCGWLKKFSFSTQSTKNAPSLRQTLWDVHKKKYTTPK